MIWLIGSILYGAVALVAARAIAGALAWNWAPDSLRRDGRPDGAQWFGASCLGVVAGVLWPVMLLLWHLPAPVIGAEREHLIAERERRVRDLERELGIK